MSHKIQKQVLQLDIPSGLDSWRFQNELRDTFNSQVLPRLEKACDELGLDDGTVFKIDSLLLDTGEISRHGLTQDWAGQIERQFKEQIKRLKTRGPMAAEKVEVQTTNQSDLSAVLHFLKLGVLPWWVKNEGARTLREMLNKTINDQPQTFIARLKKLRNRELAIRRLLKLLPTVLLQKFRAGISTESNLSEQLTQTLKPLKTVPSQDALLRLDSIEIIALLAEKTTEPQVLLYEWIRQELAFGPNAHKKVHFIHKSLINNPLIRKDQPILKHKLTQVLTQIFEQLEQEQVLKKSTPSGSKFSELKEKARAKDTASSQLKKGETNAESDVNIEAQLSNNNATTEANSKNKVDAKNTPQPEPTEQTKASKEYKEQTSQPYKNTDTHSPTPADLEEDKSAADRKEMQLPPLNKEDSHVFKQLERIRQLAREKQSDAEQTVNNPAADSVTDHSANQPASAANEAEAETGSGPGQTIAEGQRSSIPTKPSNDSAKLHHPVEDNKTPSHFSYELPQVEVEECYIANAGLILFWPFLGRFFKNLDLVEDNAFKSTEAQEKAALLIQYLLGDKPELDEFALPLNKLLCALPIEHPITTEYTITDDEKEGCEELLQSTIDNWGVLKGTSIAGFQGSFLNREAVLKKQENGWLLQVEKQAFDMLLEQLPWPLSIVKITWMNEPIYVEW